MRAASGLFRGAWSSWHFASRQFAPNSGPLSASFTLFCFVFSIVSLRASVAGGSRPRSGGRCIRILNCMEALYHFFGTVGNPGEVLEALIVLLAECCPQ